MDAFELLVAVNVVISVVPFAARPILVLLFVQVKVPPVGMLVKFVVMVLSPLQIGKLAGTLTFGEGLMVIV